MAFSFLHVWNSASRTAAPAAGGAFLSVYGVFAPGVEYVCVFSGETLVKQRPAMLLSSTEMQCTVPTWSGTGTAVLSVEAHGAPLTRDPPDVYYFRFTSDYWFTAEPLEALVVDSVVLPLNPQP